MNDELPVPQGFFFGVAMSGFQVEGGFNGPGEPSNNWARLEGEGRVEPSGIAVDWWNRYEEYLDRASAIGCNMVRFGIEWARIEPAEGELDDTALDRYVAIADACLERGMEPLVTLHHFTHPAWLDDDFWLAGDSPERFAAFCEIAATRLAPKCRYWVTLNEINALVMATYLFWLFPPRKYLLDFAKAETAAGHMMAGHVAAYEIIHRMRPDAVVTTNNAGVSLYELDRGFTDLLMARRFGIKRDDVVDWLAQRREEWYRLIDPPGLFESGVRKLTTLASGRSSVRTAGNAGALSSRNDDFLGGAVGRNGRDRALDAIYSSPFECTLDVVGFDYYDPVATHHVVFPGTPTAGGRAWSLARPLWDDPPDPAGLTRYCHAHASLSPGLPVWVVENGMCTRTQRGRSFPRIDGWDRARYLRENIGASVRALDGGVPLGAYLHWSLVDNYEWGSYQPRFGIHGVDRDRGTKVLDTDAVGVDAAGAYRRIIEGLSLGDRSVIG